ncbi:MAG: hypothetical protein NTY25_00950 [Planctomycetia bacterium]|nr:hypothetical protein [Planctomycetia bacterium]
MTKTTKRSQILQLFVAHILIRHMMHLLRRQLAKYAKAIIEIKPFFPYRFPLRTGVVHSRTGGFGSIHSGAFCAGGADLGSHNPPGAVAGVT